MKVEKSELIETLEGLPGFSLASDDVKDDTTLSDMGLDSLDSATFLLSVEEKYGVKIPDEDMGDLETLGDIIAYVEKKGS